MNTKVITILLMGAMGLSTVAAFAAAGCSSQKAVLKETTPATRIHETVETEPEKAIVVKPVSQNNETFDPETVETISLIELDAIQTVSTTKVAKKAAKKSAKKTAKKAVKKASKKTFKKSAKKTTKKTAKKATAKQSAATNTKNKEICLMV